MTGTGTQSDPYITPTWEDFCTAMNSSGVYISIPEGTEWDFNDIAPEGASTPFTGSGNTVYGNGSSLRNISIRSGVFWHTHGCFYDLNFFDIYCASANVISMGEFRHCRFSGKLYGNSVFAAASSAAAHSMVFGVSGKGCAFNLAFYDSAVFSGSFQQALICPNIYFSGESAGNNGILIIRDGLIQGKIPFKVNSQSGVAIYADGCIIDAESDMPLINQATGSSYRKSAVNCDRVTGSVSGFIEADSSTIRSTAFLAAQGFPIGDDDE